jgi:group I intron endonuclease
MGYIYKITNTINNKCYVGQTLNDVKERWRQHKKKGTNCRYLKHAFIKYGFDKFKFELICICFDENLDKYEIEYIKKFNCLSPDGYNLKSGGLGGGRLSKESKEQISKSLKNMYLNGYIHPNKGIKLSDAHRNKLSIAHKGRKLSEEHLANMKDVGNKKILQFNLTGELLNVYKSGKQAAEKNNTTKAGISMVCGGKRIQLKGFKYRFEDSNFTNLLESIRALKC